MFRTAIHKGIRVLIFYLCLWLFTLFSFSLVKAEGVLSDHNEEQAAKQAAMDRLFDSGCTRTSMRRTGQFQVISESRSQLDIIGYTITVNCVKWGTEVSSSVVVYVFTWEAPTAREDGEGLPPEEILGYNVYANSELIATTTETQWEYVPSSQVSLPVGIAVTTLDTRGQESSKTEEIRVSQ